MNVKESGLLPAVIVGVIVAGANIFIARSVERGDSTSTTLATLTERVQHLSDQVQKLTEQPYVRRDEFENRAAGIEQRVGNVERAVLERSDRTR